MSSKSKDGLLQVLSFEEAVAIDQAAKKFKGTKTSKGSRAVDNFSTSFNCTAMPTGVSYADVEEIDLKIPSTMSERMFTHQQEAVSWLAKVHSRYPGCILGDDMGMGKTFTVTSFLAGLMCNQLASKVLILCPVSVLENWYRELSLHLLPHLKVSETNQLSSVIVPYRSSTVLPALLLHRCHVASRCSTCRST